MSKIKSFSWQEPDTLHIDTNFGKRKCQRNFLAGGHQFFHAEINGDEVHVLTGPRGSSRPSKRHIVTSSGLYKGSRGV